MERIHFSRFTSLLITVVAVVAFLAGAYTQSFLDKQSSKLTDLGSGRFNLVISSTPKHEKYLVDSQTGKVWQLLKTGESFERTNAVKPLIKDKIISQKTSDKNIVLPNIPADSTVVEVIKNGKFSKQTVQSQNLASSSSIAAISVESAPAVKPTSRVLLNTNKIGVNFPRQRNL